MVCGYDSLFDMVDHDGSGTISLAENLSWVTSKQPEAAEYPTAMQTWIEYFYSYVICWISQIFQQCFVEVFELIPAAVVVDLTVTGTAPSPLMKCTEQTRPAD